MLLGKQRKQSTLDGTQRGPATKTKQNQKYQFLICFIICYTNGGFGRPFFLFVTKSHDAPTLCLFSAHKSLGMCMGLAKFNFPNI